MPRKARIDAPGALHHVIARGIEKRDIFWDDHDRNNFLEAASPAGLFLVGPVHRKDRDVRAERALQISSFVMFNSYAKISQIRCSRDYALCHGHLFLYETEAEPIPWLNKKSA